MNRGEDCIAMTLEALALAKSAVRLDDSGNYEGAIDYYDKAILALDEVLPHLLPLAAESILLLARRALYDNRIEVLRFATYGSESRDPVESTVIALSTENVGDAHRQALPGRIRQSFVQFCEFRQQELQVGAPRFEMPPKSLVGLPYWQLRVIKCTIESGGFITPSLFFPQQVWLQHQMKFSGLAVKSAAFTDILSSINTIVFNLEVPPASDLMGLRTLVHSFSVVRSDFMALQSQLSRSFPYIDPPSESGAESAESSRFNQESPKSRNLSKMATGFFMAAGKTVRSTFENSMFRFNALPSSVSGVDFVAFTSLLSALCDKAQIFDIWYDKLEAIRETLVLGGDTVLGVAPNDYSDAQKLTEVESCLAILCHIAVFMRDIVCNMVLRDMEVLLEHYLIKMRKSYARMIWEVDMGRGNISFKEEE